MARNKRDGWKNILPFISIILLLFNTAAYANENSGHVNQPANHKLISLPQIRPWTGDLDGMLKRRTIRILVPYSKTLFFIDKGRQFGVEAELGRQLEVWLNKRHKVKTFGLHVAFIPTTRDAMTESLATGKGDILAANLTITPERLEKVDFTIPWLNDVHEILIQNKDSPKINKIEDLAGNELYVRRSSSYYSSLVKLSDRLQASGLKPLVLKQADENLEDEDLIEMVNAGVIPFIVVDQHKAGIWSKIFPNVIARSDIIIGDEGNIGWAIRKNSPLLKSELDEFIKEHRIGTGFGNSLAKKYFSDTRIIKNAITSDESKKFTGLVDIFKRYGDENNFDYLMIAAQGYQESQLNQNRRSARGAVGVMQLLPATAAGKPINITGIEKNPEINIKAGVRYLKHLRDTYINDPGISERNRTLMAFAAYNAGPGNLRAFRQIAKESGLNPDIWFNNVELGAAKKVGRETVQYVSNIYKYFISYQLIARRSQAQEKARDSNIK
jgi:membrane-bound lytic murein transglycosylase MltF